MAARACARVAMVMLVVSAACGPKVKPGLEVTVDPDPGGGSERRTARIAVHFSRPMVAAGSLGGPAGSPPLRIEPAVRGTFRWADERTLVFTSEAPLPRSTRFLVEIPAGTRALDGLGLASAHRRAFETARPALEVELVERGAKAPPGRWAPPDQRVKLKFDQPVRARDVARRCGYESAKGRIRAQPTTEAATATEIEVAPAGPLAARTAYTFRCDDDLSGAEGPLGIGPP